MAKTPEIDQNNLHNNIAAGTEIKGNIRTNGNIRVDGILEGNLVTLGKVVIGDTGKVVGEIQCKNSDIEGEVEGKIIVKELLSLKKTSKFHGEILTDKLAIEPGAIFTGTCEMSGDKLNGTKTQQKAPEQEKSAK